MSNRLLDRTDSPPSLWLLAMQYTAYLLNHTASTHHNNDVPLQILTGVTQDISTLLRFSWYERLYYRVDETSFPSDSTEACGRFVGFSQNVGNTLTFAILTDETNQIIYHSEVRTAEDGNHLNLRTNNWGEDEPDSPRIICSHADNDKENEADDKDNAKNGEHMAIIDVEDLVGTTFPMPNASG